MYATARQDFSFHFSVSDVFINVCCFVLFTVRILSTVCKTLHDFPRVSTSKTRIINTSFSTIEGLKKVLVKANGFLAATRRDRGKISTASAICVVDPALILCNTMGFATFLLQTLDEIMLRRALGNNRPVIYWRSCYSACSSDPKVNSWDWYFEPVNPLPSAFFP